MARESFYIAWALQNYKSKVLNILFIAGSSLGCIHGDENKLKMSILKLGNKNSLFNKLHTDLNKKKSY